MDIARINELLKENEQIREKIIKLKRKLNLKNYSDSQKCEMKNSIKYLKNIYSMNQSTCSYMSGIKAGTFARLICKHLNKTDINYKIKCVSLNFDINSKEYCILKRFVGQTSGKFLVVTNRQINSIDDVSLTDFRTIPIAFMKSDFVSNLIDDFDLAILENQNITLFEAPENLNEHLVYSDIKTFNFGKAGDKETYDNSFAKLRNAIKTELGIWTKQTEIKEEKQL